MIFLKKILLIFLPLIVLSSIIYYGIQVSNRAINKVKVKGETVEVSPIPTATPSSTPTPTSTPKQKLNLSSTPTPTPIATVIPLSLPSQQSGLTAEQIKRLTEEINRAYQEKLKEYNSKYSNDTSYSPPTPPPTYYYYNDTESVSNKPSASYCSSKRASIDANYQSKLTSENSRYQNELSQVREGFAGAGTYFSGERLRNEGLVEIKHNENVAQIEAEYNQQLAALKQEGC